MPNASAEPPSPPDADEAIIRQVSPAEPYALWDRFAARLEALGDTARAVRLADAFATLENVVREMDLGSGIADADVLEWLKSRTARPVGASGGGFSLGGATLSAAGDRDAAFQVDFGLTLCDCAVAETGTLVLAAGPHRARLTSLAPRAHVALVPFSRLVPDLMDVAPAMRDSAGAGTQARATVWITGSSRTADIESILIRGVHGPGRVIALGIVDA
jgi:hypothetical protein